MPTTMIRGYAVPLRTKRPEWLKDPSDTEALEDSGRTSGVLCNFNGYLPDDDDDDDDDDNYEFMWNSDIPTVSIEPVSPINENNIADIAPLGDAGRCFELTTKDREQCMSCGGWFKLIHSPWGNGTDFKILCRRCCTACN